MFMGSRYECLHTIAMAGSAYCCYLPGHKNPEIWPVSLCDCKYCGPTTFGDSNFSEKTGCPEMKTLYRIVEALNDEEWEELIKQSGGIPSGSILKRVIHEKKS